MTMVIIAGHSIVDAADRDRYVTAHRDLVRRARQAPGCLDVAIAPDPLDPGRVNVFERWESTEHLDAWRAVAKAPRSKIQLSSVDVMMYVVSDVRPPFGGPRLHSAPDATPRQS
jgi:quinol monooxygenase YgiN